MTNDNSDSNATTPQDDATSTNATSTDAKSSSDIEAFYHRADAVIELANSQLSPASHSGQVNSSLLYAAARFSVSAAATGFVNGADLAKEKEEIIDFYAKQYRKMLSDNLDDYSQHFDKYVKIEYLNKP